MLVLQLLYGYLYMCALVLFNLLNDLGENIVTLTRLRPTMLILGDAYLLNSQKQIIN